MHFNPFSTNSRPKANFSFQFMASYVWYSMEKLAGDLLFGLKLVKRSILLSARPLEMFSNLISDWTGCIKLNCCRTVGQWVIKYSKSNWAWQFVFLFFRWEGRVSQIEIQRAESLCLIKFTSCSQKHCPPSALEITDCLSQGTANLNSFAVSSF